jgi:cytochrome P450
MAIEPVLDWTTDYDIFDDEFVRDPYPVWEDLRAGGCPVAHTARWGGSWMPTKYEDVVAFAHDVETFTSRQILVVPPIGDGTQIPYSDVAAPPITSDPPEHHWARRLILPIFSPQSVAKYEQGTRDLCHQLIDGFVDAGRADAAADYAQQIPVRVIATMLGVGTDRSDEFTSWVRGVLEVGLKDPVVRIANRVKIIEFFMEQIADRRANPRDDDLITELTQGEVDGHPIPDTHILGTCNLMLVAGIDTTWSAIGSSLWHLAQHPEHRAELRERPEIWPMAVEELLRAYSPVTMARLASKDVEVAGCPIREGDRVLMTFPAANRDPDVFENPDEVILDREHNRHVAFGAGIHRCAGSNLARLELRVALETWLERIPEFALADPGSVTWAGGQVRGPRQCHVIF